MAVATTGRVRMLTFALGSVQRPDVTLALHTEALQALHASHATEHICGQAIWGKEFVHAQAIHDKQCSYSFVPHASLNILLFTPNYLSK